MGIFDEVGSWTEIKLDIIRKYAQAYSKIISKQENLHHVYIDAFAGPGKHISRSSGEMIPGSPLNALNVEPPFAEYYFIDIKREKISELEKIAGEREDVHLYHGDCNEILLTDIFPKMKYKEYKRALCLLDPYGLHLDWKVIQKAGEMRTIEIFLNFPIHDITRNVLHQDISKVKQDQKDRLTRFWGDESWREVAYSPSLFDDLEIKQFNEDIAQAFRTRINKIAGFEYVPKPVLMRNTKGGDLYYLFFASHNKTGAQIAKDIFKKYIGSVS